MDCIEDKDRRGRVQEAVTFAKAPPAGSACSRNGFRDLHKIAMVQTGT